MRKTTKRPGEKIVKDIQRATRKQYSAEEKIRIVLDGLRGEDSIAELYRREGVIPPFLMGLSRRIHAAVFSFMAGVMPPMPMLGRSLL